MSTGNPSTTPEMLEAPEKTEHLSSNLASSAEMAATPKCAEGQMTTLNTTDDLASPAEMTANLETAEGQLTNLNTINDLASPAEKKAASVNAKRQKTTLDTTTVAADTESPQKSTELVSVGNANKSHPHIDPRGLRFAPPEVRDMIFKFYFGSIPFDWVLNLFEALKGDVSLQKEAKDAFVKFGTLCICWEDQWNDKLPSFSDVHKLEVRFNYGNSQPTFNSAVFMEENPRRYFRYHKDAVPSRFLLNGSNITELKVDIAGIPNRHVWGSDYWAALSQILSSRTYLPKLKKFTLVLGRDQAWFADDGYDANVTVRYRSFFGDVSSDPNRSGSNWVDLAMTRASLEKMDEELKEYDDVTEPFEVIEFKPTPTTVETFEVTDLLPYPGILNPRPGRMDWLRIFEAGFGFLPKYTAWFCPWLQYEYVWEAGQQEVLTWTPQGRSNWSVGQQAEQDPSG